MEKEKERKEMGNLSNRLADSDKRGGTSGNANTPQIEFRLDDNSEHLENKWEENQKKEKRREQGGKKKRGKEREAKK